MKLFTRYSRINLLANIAIFLIASVAFYFSLQYVLIHEIDEDLEIEEEEIIAHVKKHDRLPENLSVPDQVISFNQASQNITRHFTTVRMLDTEDSVQENFRQLVFTIKADSQLYQATVSKSLEGSNHLLRSILLITVSTIFAILIVSLIINRVVLKRIWKPFYQSLNAVSSFRISKNQPLHLPFTNIEEFQLMNQTLEGITKTSQLEYLSLKTFSENASHEIQTPIAIIRSKLDLMIQDEQLSESQGNILQGAFNAIEKLSRLNQSLLLLAKIENNQFEDVQLIDLENKLRSKFSDFQELWQSQSITINESLEKTLVKMNVELADILLNNLLGNATKHNYAGGQITITLHSNQLVVANTSQQKELETEKMFHRFYKQSLGNEHNGLGLSIVKQIADASGFKIAYEHKENLHCFTVFF